MFSLPKFSIKRPVCILICIVSLVTFGISSIFEMPLESTPEIEMPVLMVMTQYSGASPEEVDKMVTDRVEAAIANVSEVDSTQSVSSEGVSMVVMMFEYSADIDKKYQDVSSALALVPLPDNCSDPVLIEVNTSNLNNSVMSLSIKAEANDNVKAYVEDNVVPEIEKIEGVSDVSVSGGSRKYVQVLLDENKLSQYKITMQQVVSAIATAEYEVTLGDLDRGNVTVGLIGSQEFTEYHGLENVPITLSSGDIIHVSDVAQVNLADEEISSYYRQDGKETIGISVAKNQSANTVDICNQVLKVIDNLNSQQLGLEIEVTSNSGEDIMENIRSVATALVEGLVIAVVVLWLFLGEWKASLIVGLSMPFSVLATLILMSFFGMTINLISLGGLVIGIGMLVDNSIVVIDSCFKAQTGERSFEENVIKGAELVLGSIVASTLTTIVVFLPIGMMQGMSGQLFHDSCRNTCDLLHIGRRIFRQHILLQLRPALHVCMDKRLVAQAVPLETMQDAQGQGPVAAWPGLDKPVGPPRRLGSIRINAPDLSAPLLRFPHILEKMEVRRQHADAPENDEIAVLRFLRPHAQRMSHDAVPSVVLSGRANRPFQLRRAEPIK